jgi:putative oxidoreductase
MPDWNNLTSTWAPRLLSVLRIIAGFLFLWHGTQKLFGFPPRPGATGPAAPLDAFMLFAGVLEFGGGLLILLGLFTRPVAFILSGMMAVAYWLVHGTNALLPLSNGGELAALYCFVFLYLCAAGAGPWSLDATMRRAA